MHRRAASCAALALVLALVSACAARECPARPTCAPCGGPTRLPTALRVRALHKRVAELENKLQARAQETYWLKVKLKSADAHWQRRMAQQREEHAKKQQKLKTRLAVARDEAQRELLRKQLRAAQRRQQRARELRAALREAKSRRQRARIRAELRKLGASCP